MAYVGYSPALSPTVPDQIKPVAEQLYRRIDGANVPQHVFNNALINSACDWWQRGTGPFQATGIQSILCADRWVIGGTGPNGYIVVSRTPLAFGENPGSVTRASLGAGCTGNTTAADGCYIQQRIEGVDTFAGKRVAVTGKIRQVGGSGARVSVDFSQTFGTGGSPDVPIILPAGGASSLVTLTSDFQPFKLIYDVPSMSGKIIGTANDFLCLTIWLSAGSNWAARTNNLGLQSINVGLTDVEVKEVKPGYGDQVPGFERVPREIDFQRCQRYYQIASYKGPGGGNNSGSYTPSYVGGITMFPVVMRTTPSVIFTDNVGTPNTISCGASNGVTLSGGGIGAVGNFSIFIDAIVPVSNYANWFQVNYKLSAEL